MDINPRREFSFSQLTELSMRANIAFAVRCAMRLRPCFQLPADVPRRREQTLTVDGAIRIASAFCRGEPLEPGRAVAALHAVLAVAEATCEDTRYAGFAALRALEAVVHAEEFLTTREDVVLTEVIAAAFGAGRVLAANADPSSLDQIVVALTTDAEALRNLGLGTTQELGARVDPAESGPLGSLWPDGVPAWYSQPTTTEAR